MSYVITQNKISLVNNGTRTISQSFLTYISSSLIRLQVNYLICKQIKLTRKNQKLILKLVYI